MQLSSNNETPRRRHWPAAAATNLYSNCALAAARGLATHLSQAVSLSSPSLANLWNLLRSRVCMYYSFVFALFCHHSVFRADTVSMKLGLSSTHVHRKSGKMATACTTQEVLADVLPSIAPSLQPSILLHLLASSAPLVAHSRSQ